MFALSSVVFSKNPSAQLKDKALDLKNVVMTVPSMKTEPARSMESRRRATAQMENRPHGWYMVEKDETNEDSVVERPSTQRRRSITKEQPKETSQPIDESASLKEQLEHFEQREQSTLGEKKRLEVQLEELTQKYNSDEQVLASFEHDKQRFRNLINVEQKKCFDFQQQIIALKNQLKSEHESKVQAEGQLDALKKKQKSEKRHSRKQSQSEASKELPVEHAEHTVEHPAEHPESAWHTSAHKGFTEMVAEAQREEIEHPKKFSEVLKESMKMDEPVVADSKPEFVVIGGDLSTQHIIGDVQSVTAI